MSLGKVRLSRRLIERFQSRGRLLYKFIEKKRKAFLNDSFFLYTTLKGFTSEIVQLVLVWETNMAVHLLFWANENSNHYGGCEAMSKGS